MGNSADGRLVIDTSLDNTGFEQGSEKLLSAIENLSKRIDAMGASMQQSFSGISSILQTLAAAAQQSASGTNTSAQAATQAAQQTAAAQATATQATNQAAQATSNYDKELAKLQAQIDKAKAGLTAYYAEIAEIQQDTDDMLRLTEDPEQVKNTLEIEQIEIDKVNAKYAAKISALEALEAEYARVAEARDAANQPQQEPQDTQSSAEGDAAQGVLDFSQAAQEAAQSAQGLENASNALGVALGTVARAGLSAAKSIAKIAFKAVAAAAKKAVSGLKSFSSHSRKAVLSSNALVKSLTSLKRLLITRVKRMFISSIFKNVQEDIQSLAQYSSAFNASMNAMKGSAKQLSGNVAVALGNLIMAVEPIITRLLTLLNSAITRFNEFFALLNGKKTVTSAATGAEDYAQSMEAASQAQQKLNRELYSFDELNRQSDKSSSNADTGGVAGAAFEEIPINLPAGVSDWVDRLKAAWGSQDWYGVGEILAEGLNMGVQRVDNWINTTLRPKGVEWAARTAKILNGLTDGIDWPMIGQTIADGLNTIVDIYNTFMDGYNFENLGMRVGMALNSLFDNVNWDELGRAFAQKWNALINVIHGIVNEAHWADWGADIGTAINSWFNEIEWEKLADDLGKLPNKINIWLQNVIQNINWAEVGATLGRCITNLITGFDFGQAAQTISSAIGALLRAVAGLLSNIDWYEVVSKLTTSLGETIRNINWLEILASLGSAIISLLGGIVRSIIGFVGGWQQKLANIFSALGMDTIAGFFQGIADKLHGVSNWIKEHIVDPVVNAVQNFFGIHSPSTVFAEIGQNLIQGLFNGISNVWHTITDFFSKALTGLKNLLSDAWGNIKSTAQNAWNGVKTSITGAFQNAKNGISNTATQIKSGLSATWNSIKSTAQTAVGNLSTTVSTKFTNLKTNLTSAWSGLRTALGNVNWNTIGHNLVVGLQNGISGAWGNLMTGVSNLVNGLIQRIKNLFGVHSPSTVFAEIGAYLDEGLENGLEDGKRGLLATATNVANAVTDSMTPDTAQVDMATDGVISGMQAVISGLSDVAATFMTIADVLTNTGGFTIPQIAAGSVVPYQAKVAGTASTGGDPNNDNALLTSILAEIQALSRSVRNGDGNQNSDIRVIVNGRELFRAMVDENNQAIRRDGRSPLRTA